MLTNMPYFDSHLFYAFLLANNKQGFHEAHKANLDIFAVVLKSKHSNLINKYVLTQSCVYSMTISIEKYL